MTPTVPVLLNSAVESPVTTFAKDQSQYKPLPALVSRDDNMRVTTRWRLSWRERLRILLTGNLWLQVLTYGNQLQPVKLLAAEPPIEDCL